MTIINQKSISGITSITTAAAGDNLLTVHTNNGTERLRIDSSGNTRVTAGIVTTLTVTGDVDIADKIIHTGDTNTAIRFPAADTVTVETAGSERLRINSSGNIFIGDNTDRTSFLTSTANNLQIDGGVIFEPGSGNDVELYNYRTSAIKMGIGGAEKFRITSDGKIILKPGADSGNILQLNGADTTSEVLEAGITSGHVQLTATHASGGSNTCGFIFRTRGSSGGTSEKLRIQSGGGISFNGDTAAANALDDYEEGTFEPKFTSTAGDFTSVTHNADTGARYVKVGNLVTVNGCARCTAIDTSNRSNSETLCIGGLPFTNVARNNGDNADNIGSCRVPVWGNTNNTPHAIQARQNQTFCSLLNYEIDAVTNTNLVSQANNEMMVQFSLQYSAI